MTSVQRIQPRAGTAWQGQHQPPQKSDEGDGDPSRRRKPERAPPEPDTGRIIDKDA